MPRPSARLHSNTPAAAAGRAARARLAPWIYFILPLATLCFLLGGPRAWPQALLWTAPVWACVAADYFSPAERAAPRPGRLDWLLDARLYALFGLQLANVALLLEFAGRLRWATPAEFCESAANLLALRVLAGSTACCCGIALAHELIHRRARHLRWMGRMLLWTVCYDHFAVGHAGVHHRLAATPADPATARFGERFGDFFWRSLRGQWLAAWRLETRRLARLQAPARWARHRVAQGLAVQLALLGLVYAGFGLLPLLLFLYLAWVAVRMLEAVNYVQHWGLARAGARCGGADAWSCDSWFSLHAFIGLTRHADHHARAGRPCHRLLHRAESPRLPGGYFVMALLVRLRNGLFCELAARELKARKLGPFRPGGEPFSPAGIVFAAGSVKVSAADGLPGKKPRARLPLKFLETLMIKNKLNLAGLMMAGLLALTFFSPAQAGVYKCTDAHQRTFYQDKPCQDLIATRLPAWLNGLAGREEERAFLWKAVGDKGTVYLLGALRYGTQSMYPLPQMVMDAFGAANVLVMEADIWNEAEKERAALLKGRGRYADKDSLEAHVKPVTWGKAVEIGKKLGINKEHLGQYQPWLAAIMLTDESLKQAGYTPDLSVEQTFMREAQGKKAMLNLENVQDQIKTYEELTGLEQEQMLLQSLQELGRAPDIYTSTADAWKHGDAEAMEMLTRQSYDLGSELSAKLFKIFYEDRAERMTNTLKEMSSDGQTYFVVAGSGLLVGDHGILKLLERKGFKVTQP